MIALQNRDWFTNATTQLVANAFNRITPGGGATGFALQVRMLSDAGIDAPRAVSGLTVTVVAAHRLPLRDAAVRPPCPRRRDLRP